MIPVVFAACCVLGATPDAQHAAALRDLVAIARADPGAAARTRYLDLSDVSNGARAALRKALAFAVNSTSWRTTLAALREVAPDLLALDLAALGWDRAARDRRIRDLRARGIRFARPEDLLDPWETFAQDQIHFKAPQAFRGTTYRGWIDPVHDAVARTISRSASFIVRADWLLPRLLLEKELDGYYSQTLLLPDAEADLYTLLAVDVARFDKEDGFRRGTFLVNGRDSYVALHNREMQLIKTPVGQDVGFLWRTFDVARDDVAEKRVLNSLAGNLKLDGREIIFSLPNGLHGYRLSNAKGDRVAEVPPNIAQDKRGGPHLERRVLTAYKCVDCHGPDDGLIAPGEQARQLLVGDPRLAFVVQDKDPARVEGRRREIEDYYLTPLGRAVEAQRAGYKAALAATNGLAGADNARALVIAVEQYLYWPVDLQIAASETGLDYDCIKAALRSLRGEAAVLGQGQPIPRPAWDEIFDDVMLSQRYPWDNPR
jgi:hypothetical protein